MGKSKLKVTGTASAIWKKWWVKTLLGIVLFLVILRIILSPVATYEANKYLATHVPGYYGHVKCIHFALYRGAYKLDSIILEKVDSTTGQRTPFISCVLIDLSVQWKALLHRSFVGKIYLRSPEVRFTKDKVEPAQVVKDTVTFRKLVDVGMPLKINRIELDGGRLRYKDETSHPQVDISMTKIYVLAQNLSNSFDSASLLPSSIKASANVYGGSVSADTRLNLLEDNPTFELKTEVKDLDLTKLNNFFMAYGKFTIDSGDFNLYAEAAAKDGNYLGYLKPIIKGLRLVGPNNRDEGFITKLWERVIGAVAFVFKNFKHDQLATKIPFEGSFGKPHANVLYAFFQVLRNAFVEALSPSLDNEINITTVGKKDENKPGFKMREKMEGKKEKAETRKQKKEKKKKAKEAGKNP